MRLPLPLLLLLLLLCCWGLLGWAGLVLHKMELDTVSEEAISEERMEMLRVRHEAATLACRILTTVGAAELVGSSSWARGLVELAVGLALERQRSNPSRLLGVLALVFGGVLPLVSAWVSRRNKVFSSGDAFQLVLQAAVAVSSARVLFLGRRLKQLEELKREARKRRRAKLGLDGE